MTAKPRFRLPVPEDGASVHNLIAHCPPLDGNSLYCNLLQCTHFSDTSVAAEIDGELSGFISGYLIPQRPSTLFIWQVAVGESARGMGLANQMLKEILARPACAGVGQLETTITPDNKASWALFQGLARDLGAPVQSSVMFDQHRHFGGLHASEMLVCIGPFQVSESYTQRMQASKS